MPRLSGQRNQCPTCGEFFNSNAAFTKHRVGRFESPSDPRRCATTEEMLAKGMRLGGDGFWRGEAMKATYLAKKESEHA